MYHYDVYDIADGINDAIKYVERAIEAVDGMIEIDDQVKDLKATLVDLLKLKKETDEVVDELQAKEYEEELRELNSYFYSTRL